MKKDQITRELNAMVGKKYRYQNEVHNILRFSNENVVKIITDKKDITFLPDDFDPDLFTAIATVSEELIISPKPERENKYLTTPSAVTTTGTNTLISQQGFDIASMIKENIDKVKSDPDYVPQAEAVNNAIKVFIDLAKVEVEMIKVTR